MKTKKFKFVNLILSEKKKKKNRNKKIDYEALNLGKQDIKSSKDNIVNSDILKSKYFGLATHYKKKIITTNPKVKELEFYHPDNILIFTENTSSEEITIFLTKPYHLIDENLINKYRLDHWLENRLISHQNGQNKSTLHIS